MYVGFIQTLYLQCLDFTFIFLLEIIFIYTMHHMVSVIFSFSILSEYCYFTANRFTL